MVSQTPSGFVSHQEFGHLLSVEPSPFAVIYWGLELVTLPQLRQALPALLSHQRIIVLGRFAYVEAPPAGQPDRRTYEVAGTTPVQASLRLADLWASAPARRHLEHRVIKVLAGHLLPIWSSSLSSRTGLPRRTLEAVCYAGEARGTLQVQRPSGTPPRGDTGDFLVIRCAPVAATPV